MVETTLEELAKIKEQYKNKKIVFCSGSFDLPHAGHVLFFEECKKQGDILVVGVGTDKAIRGLKEKGRPILNEYIRLKTVDSFKPVDYALLNESPREDHFQVVKEIFKKLQPDSYITNKDAFDIPTRRKICNEMGVELKILDRACPPEYENISVTEIIRKIKYLS